NERGSSPAVLFDSVKGYPKGYRVLVNSLGSTKRLGLSLGMEQNLSALEFVSQWRKRSKALKHIAPRVVRDGPVLENVQRGEEVNILKFPTPRWFELDGGRYIGTGSVNITHDAEEGWTNLGTARIMIHDHNSEVLWAVCTRSDPAQDIEILRRCWSGPLDPIIHKDAKGLNSRAIIDATRPYEWKETFPQVSRSSPALREQVLAKWGEKLS
ncbi:MAG: UbiD family decarboxylase domain-containing protein, partial [Candidatus Binatia bacterium]